VSIAALVNSSLCILAAAVATAAWWLLSNASEPVGLCLYCDDLLMHEFIL
jgi:hypothetical protein